MQRFVILFNKQTAYKSIILDGEDYIYSFHVFKNKIKKMFY